MRQPKLLDGIDWPEFTQEWWKAWGRDPRTKACAKVDWLYLMNGALLHAQVWSGDTAAIRDLRAHEAKFEQRLAELNGGKAEVVEEKKVTPLDELARRRQTRGTSTAREPRAEKLAH
ncbi:phage terminase small subunit [Trueperella pyogenes]